MDDREWQKTFHVLAASARLVLLIPSDSPGTVWEINWLKGKGLFNKTIFIMPHINDAQTLAQGQFDVEQHWEKTSRTLLEWGLGMPQYSADGMFFSLGQDGRLLRSVRMNAGWGTFAKNIQTLLRDLSITI